MYTVAVVPRFQVSNLAVQDSANASSWSIQSNLQVGNKQYGDQSTTLTSVPSLLAGSTWIRTAAGSNVSAKNPIATFAVNQEATVYVGFDTSEISSLPSWVDSTWTKTSLTMTNSASKSFTFYYKTYLAGQVSLGPVGTSTYNMYTVAIVPGGVAGPAVQLSNLTVLDTANAKNWSLQTNLAKGAVQYGDRGYTLVSIPTSLVGASWIRTANSSKAYTKNPTVTFTINRLATVYVAVDTRIGKPSWMSSSWVNTGMVLTDNQGSGTNTFALYAQIFPAGTVSLGPAGNTSDNMYTVIVQ
jgi:hypothetical protein